MGVVSEKRAYREELLMSTLRAKKKMDISEVVELLNISESTARRFFDELEKKGSIIRTYGGIKIAEEPMVKYYFDDAQLLQSEQKRRIGEHAVSFVENGDIIYIDSGTTMRCFAMALSSQIQNGALTDLQVFTNSLTNLLILKDYCEVNLIGGLFRGKRQDFCGHLAEMVLESISFEKCFLGTDGISANPREGIMTTDIFTSKTNEILVSRASKVFLLADSTKFHRRSFIKYASPEDIYLFITDKGLSSAAYKEFSTLQLKIEMV